MSARKRFDRALYDEYDKKARQVTMAYLKSTGMDACEHPDRYAQDLIAFAPLDDFEYHVECEVKLVWTGKDFPYDSVQLPQRKHKFFDGKTKFFIWNKELDTAVTFWDNEISDLIPVEVPNKYISKGEYFYQIPMERVNIVSANL